MKKTLSIIALSAGLSAAPLAAQDKADRAVEEAVEAVVEAAEAATEQAEDSPVMVEDIPEVPAETMVAIPPPAPVMIADRVRKAPVPKRYGAMRPSQADYPAAAWAAGHEGRVRFELAVDADGKPTDCTIIDSSGHPELDEVTCKIAMERGEFRPQVDENDEPVAGTYSESYTWRKREQEFPGSFRFKAEFLLDETGMARECEILAIEGEIPDNMQKSIDREPCPFSRSNRRGPYRDENGEPVTKRITVEFAVQVEDADPQSEE